MDLAPSLLSLFDAVIGKDTVRRREILAGISQKNKDEDGFDNLNNSDIMPDGYLPEEPNLSSFNYNSRKEISLEKFPEDLEEQIILERKRIDKNCNLEMNGLREKKQSRDESVTMVMDEADGTVKETVAKQKSKINETSKVNKRDRTKERKDRPASAEILMEVGEFVVMEPETTPKLKQRKSSRINPPIHLTLNLHDISQSPFSSPPPSPPPSPKNVPPDVSYLDRIVQEVVDTEHKYVSDLAAIIESYLEPIRANSFSPLTEEKFNILFCNLKEIYAFNKDILDDLERCNNDPVYVAECFLDSEENFSIYTTYCTNYPEAVKVLTECANNEIISRYFREIQSRLGHGLPLGAYLLKPVQRILKYHLLFQDMCKHFSQTNPGYETIKDALESTVDIARHINEMKRKHEDAIHVQELQSQLHGMEENLTSYGDLVLEDTFRMRKADRYLYLFEKALLICKKDDSLLTMKACIKCSNLMLCESLPREPLAFNVIPFDQPSTQYTILAKTSEQKKQWTHEIKRLILENYQSNIPAKVKELILRATTPEDEVDRTNTHTPDGNFGRNKKERKSGRKSRRRNSEPIGKQLQRGQKQVKGMKRPDLSKLGRTNSEAMEGGASPDDSLDERMEDLAEEDEIPEESEERVPSVAITGIEGGKETTKVIIPTDDISMGSGLDDFSKNPESKRDSGIGSMTITETPKSETDDRSEGESPTLARNGLESNPGQLSPRDAAKKKGSSRRQRLRTSSSKSEDDQVEQMIQGMESPDELEVLENLSEEIEDTSDVEEPKLPKKQHRSLEDAFKLRRANMKHYQRMMDRSETVWKKDDSKKAGSDFRSRSASQSLTRPVRSQTGMHPHLLLRAFSDDSQLAILSAFSKTHSYSDPNLTGSVGSVETIEESSKESSITSLNEKIQISQEDLVEAINNTFKQLKAKYRQAAASDGSDSEDTTTGVVVDDSSEGTESLPLGDHRGSDERDLEVVEVPISDTPHRVFSLARRFSVMAKEQQPFSYASVRLLKATQSEGKAKPRRSSKSDPFAERDGTKTVITVSENKNGTKSIMTNPEGSHRLSQSDLWRQHFNEMSFNPSKEFASHKVTQMYLDVSDDESDDDAFVFERGENWQSVKNTATDIEDKQEVKKPQGASPFQAPSIRQRFRSMQEQAKITQTPAQTKGRLGTTKFKSLQERLHELEQCKERPIDRYHTRIKASYSFSSDITDGSSSFGDDLSSSQASSRRSSCSSGKRSTSFSVFDIHHYNDSPDSSLQSSMTNDVDNLPIQFKSLRQRFEELERAISRPVPKYVDNMKDLGKVVESGSESTSS